MSRNETIYMPHKIDATEFADTSSFGQLDERRIEQHVDFELNEMQLKMTKVGAITNIVGGLLVIWVLYSQISFSYLLTWYLIFCLLNIINIIFSFYFEYCKVTPNKIMGWLKAYHYLIMPPVSLAWGMIDIMAISADLQHQFYIITLLLAVLICFSLGTITDFKASIISIAGLLLPSLIVRYYLGIHSVWTLGHDSGLNLGIAICFTILGTFLLITCFIGYKLIKKSINLSYINIALNEKLENMNKFLEHRVKERTIELEKSLKQVTFQATHDLLTNLPNQRLLTDYLNTSISRTMQNKQMIAVVCFTLNEIDRINDSLGHHVGDMVIQMIAKRLMNMANRLNSEKANYQITLSRKDVFVILIDNMKELNEVELSANVLFSVLEDPISIDKHVIKLTASMGVSIYPQDGKNLKTLLMNADAAMLHSKHQGGNALHIYESKINADVYEQLQLESYLHKAVKNHEFILQYQPIIDLKTNHVAGLEALIRWKHPTHGIIYPSDFIPIAEANGLILPLGEWVLKAACEQLSEWHKKGFQHLKVAVNLSARQLTQKNLTQVIKNIISQTHVDPKFLELELTESDVFKMDVAPLLQGFKAMGLSLAIDDFGTGYSGLSNLKQFSIDKLKIDKSFVQDIATNPGSKAIAANIIALAKSIDINVLAEGVETKEQLDILHEEGCDFIQGFYYSEPINVDEVTDLLNGTRLYNYEKNN